MGKRSVIIGGVLVAPLLKRATGGMIRCWHSFQFLKEKLEEEGYEVKYHFPSNVVSSLRKYLQLDREKLLNHFTRLGLILPEGWLNECSRILKKLQTNTLLFPLKRLFGEYGTSLLEIKIEEYCLKEYLKYVDDDVYIFYDCTCEFPPAPIRHYIMKRKFKRIKNLALSQLYNGLFRSSELRCSLNWCYFEKYAPYISIIRDKLCCEKGALGDTIYYFFNRLPSQRSYVIESIDRVLAVYNDVRISTVFGKYIPSRTFTHKYPNPLVDREIQPSWRGGDYIIFAASALLPKGIIDVLLASRILHTKYNIKMPIKIVGPLPKELMKLIKRIQERLKKEGIDVEIIGEVSREKLIELMKRARMLLYPSYQDSFSFVLAEALSLTLPAVMYANPGNSKTFKGIFPQVKMGDIEGLARLAAKVIENTYAYHEWLRARRKELETQVTWESVLNEEWQHWKAVL